MGHDSLIMDSDSRNNVPASQEMGVSIGPRFSNHGQYEKGKDPILGI